MRFLLSIICLLAFALTISAQELPSKSEILSDLQKVNTYYMSKYPETPSVSSGQSNWLEGAYYTGHMALFNLHPTSEAVAYALQWANHNSWNIGNRPHEADNQCAGQTYMDLYYAYGAKDDYMLSKVGNTVRDLVNRSAVNEWDWIDALYMAMPVLTRYGIYHDDTRYFDKLYDMYNSTKVSQNLYNTSLDLWYRDGRVLSGRKKKCHWSRGNGWVFGGHVRTLMYLPETDSHRQTYIDTYKKMAARLKSIQRSDGFWNACLDDSTYYPGPETSGTGFFIYGIAWGINNGILDKDTYLPTVIKGWNGLTTKALDTNGRIGYTQGVADEPKDDQPVTFASSRQYGEGNFLLAGTEVLKLASGEMPAPSEFYVKSAEMLDANILKLEFFEPADKTTTENVANYTINKDVEVDYASLSEDGMSCELTLSNIYKGAYGISFSNLKSQSDKTIAEGSGKYFFVSQGKTLAADVIQSKSVLSIYPNPVTGNRFTLDLSSKQNGKVSVRLFDIAGKLEISEVYDLNYGGLHKSISTQNLSKGVYILNVEGSGVNIKRKLVIN